MSTTFYPATPNEAIRSDESEPKSGNRPDRIALTWKLGRGQAPKEWIEANVPGAVQLDWARTQGWGPWWYGSNWKDYDGLEDDSWIYSTVLPATEGEAVFVAKGIDYQFDIFLEGEKLLSQEGMFTPVELDLTGRLDRPKELRIQIHPAPKDPTAKQANHQPRRSAKPAVSYGWDFHPRLIPLGIWDETYLSTERPWRPEVTYRLSEDLQLAELTLVGGEEWEIFSPDGSLIAEARGQNTTVRLENPKLWWPHDQGEASRYTIQIRGTKGERTLKVGLRSVKLVIDPSSWNELTAPTTFEINGRPVFVKGSNWVSPDVFPSTLNAERYRGQLELAKSANMNILRMWGGAIVQKDSFYDLCDEMGIMIWQDFPLACNVYPDDPEYLKLLDQESRSILGRLRPHPCVVVWCGGNELFNSWGGLTPQSLPLRLLDANCLELAPQTPFLMTTPLPGMKHGGYCFKEPGSGQECWNIFQTGNFTAYPEFGCGGIASLRTLRSFLPAEDQSWPTRGGVWEEHHAFESLLSDTWLDLPATEFYLGPSSTLEELVEKNQLMQSEGFRGLFEEARRQKPRCGMAMNWCLNEPWPTAANNSLIEWPCNPKPALEAVGEACRPALASARTSKFQWSKDEWFDPELWILNDSPHPIAAGTMTVWINEVKVMTWAFPELPANQNLRGPTLGIALPEVEGRRFKLRLSIEDHPEMENTYTLAMKPL